MMNNSVENYTTEILDKQSRVAEAKLSFDKLYGNVTGEYWGYLWTATQDNRHTTYPFLVTDADQRAQMAKQAIELSDAGLQVYFGVNLIDFKPSPYERSKNATVAIQVAVICDIDIVGGNHVPDDKKIYAPDFDTAKSFLPFTSSIVVNSGYGLHAYCIYAEPLTITDDNRQAANRRNVGFIKVIRNRAGDCGKTADGVGDLARVLRVPGTFNYKLGIKDDAPLCRIVEANDVRFEPTDLDEKIAALLPKPQKLPPQPKLNPPPRRFEHNDRADLDKPTEQERAIAMLPFIQIGNGDHDRWVHVGMILKANGNDLVDWERWSATQPNYTPDKHGYSCAEKWATFPEICAMSIATLHDWAMEGGYSEKDFLREWHAQHSNNIRRTRRARLTELQAQPQSADRDKKIVAAIRDACDWNHDKHGKRTTIKAVSSNLNLIFTDDPALNGLIGYDEFQAADVFLKQPPWRKDDVIKKPLEDRDDAQLAFYLRENYGELHSRDLICEATITYSQKHAFHDVKDYFYNLPRWDGEPRAESIFIKFLRVKDTPFAREVTRKWLLAAVARIFCPGCRFQFAITIQGNQGIGKSYIFERLGGAWYGVLSDDVDDSRAIDAVQAMWICELKEFKAARKADVNSLKMFIDTSADTRRPAYGRRAVKVPRHVVFGITVNDRNFLTDKTGNRRFPILESESDAGAYVEGLTDEYIAQVWAEAFHWYNELTSNDTDRDEKKIEKALELSADAKRQVEAVAEKFMRDDGLDTEIKGYLDTPIPAQVIWLTLTKEERRKFMEEAHLYIGGGKRELEARIRNRKWNRRGIENDIDALYQLLASEKEGTVYRSCGEGGLIIYGTELRQHVSVAEILAEAFTRGDKRANNYRVGEVMDNLSGWTLGERLQNADPQYPDQRKPYFRDAQIDDEPPPDDKQSETPTDNFIGEPLDLENPPF